MKKKILTGDRPTGKLHLGHYVGSLKNRVELQNSGEYDSFIMIADTQALTDNARNPEKVRENVLEVALDYLAVGIDPTKSTIFIQSQIPALSELTMYYMNLVSLSRVLRNPTVKTEISQKEFGEGVPAGFAMYPISQAADITAFNADLVPVGVDQLPMIEQTREIVRSFNAIYGEVLVEPDAIIPETETAKRLPGIDGNAKMSKSLNNGIYLSDDVETLRAKVMSMYTDPDHIHVDDPGKIDGNTVFTYLDVFASDVAKVTEMKEHYQRGGLGDVVVKKYLFEVLNDLLTPIRTRRIEFARNPAAIYEILRTGSEKANLVANETLQKVRAAIGIEYFKEKK
ncbi:tryptophan--tRNA ligase [Candidatus Saccharibacteria bacterium]|nr:tryptophan--tRNA ligase [Candidatus Saccharibacteria bacterium]MCL1963051.1 tryptophan--tRNA ligase [Candidatus Saccharibacteria bacterium]